MRRFGVVFVMLLAAAVSVWGLTLKKYGDFSFQKVHENLYVMHGPVTAPDTDNEGFMNNPAIIEGKTGLIVIDPGGNYRVGKKILTEIEKVSTKPILATINTHKHGDHWFANKALLEKYPKLKIYAHPNMIREVKAGEARKWYGILDRLTHNLAGTDREFPWPNVAIREGEHVVIDGQRFSMLHPERAHTDTDLIILHENSQTLFTGDNVMKGRFGAFDASSSIHGNVKTLEKLLRESRCRYCVPGHGPSGKKEETIEPYLHYLKTILKWAHKAYDDDKEAYEVKPQMLKELQAYGKWDGFDYAPGRHLTKAYQEIEEMEMAGEE